MTAEAPAGAAAAPAPAAAACPDCGAPHSPEAPNFCEACGYNFLTGAHGDPLPSAAVPAPAPPAPDPEPPVPAAPVAEAPVPEAPAPVAKRAWQVVVTVDPSLLQPGSPEPPSGFAPVTIVLDKESNLIGRTSEKRGIVPEIPLDHDDAVSHRHALLNQQPDGALVLRDVGSSNGTWYKGVEIKELTDVSLHDGDEFTVGHWTRIALKELL